jgi:hypothetical protein
VIIYFIADALPRFGYMLDMRYDQKTKNKKESFSIIGYLLELSIKIWRFEK